MVIEHTVRPASNQGAPDDAPEFALAPTTYNRKRNLIISITQIIFWRTFRKEEDILDKNVQNNNNTQVEVDMHHDSVPFQLSSLNHIYSVDNCTIFWVLMKTYNVVSEYPLTPMGRSHVKTRSITKSQSDLSQSNEDLACVADTLNLLYRACRLRISAQYHVWIPQGHKDMHVCQCFVIG